MNPNEVLEKLATSIIGEVQHQAARLYEVTMERHPVVTSVVVQTDIGPYRITAIPEPRPQRSFPPGAGSIIEGEQRYRDVKAGQVQEDPDDG